MDYIKRIVTIDGYKVVRAVYPRTIDPRATEDFVNKKFEGMTLSQEEINQAYDENVVYSDILDNEEVITRDEYLELSEKIKNLEEKKLIISDGTIVQDNRDLEYWITKNGKWSQKKIEHIGEEFPEGAVLDKNLTSEQRQEIAIQKETDRMAALTPEQKALEKENAINNAKSAARIRKEEAEIADEEFNAKAWFQQMKAEIEAKYA
jgi:hypothetical protein